jgi:hypothetical protein
MFWGAAASVVAGIATLLLMAIGLWPPGQPLSILVARTVLHAPRNTVGVLALAGMGQLAMGATMGALLCFLSRPVTMASALGLGLLRWVYTGTLTLTLLGFGDFGLRRSPLLFAAIAVPHLAWALAMGALMHRDDERLVGLFVRPRVSAYSRSAWYRSRSRR